MPAARSSRETALVASISVLGDGLSQRATNSNAEGGAPEFDALTASERRWLGSHDRWMPDLAVDAALGVHTTHRQIPAALISSTRPRSIDMRTRPRCVTASSRRCRPGTSGARYRVHGDGRRRSE